MMPTLTQGKHIEKRHSMMLKIMHGKQKMHLMMQNLLLTIVIVIMP
jgi:hypothetical protein